MTCLLFVILLPVEQLISCDLIVLAALRRGDPRQQGARLRLGLGLEVRWLGWNWNSKK